MRVLFCAGAGRIRTGRPSADGKKQSCGLFFRPRLANPPAPTKKLWQRCCRSFFSLLYRTKPAKAVTDFQSAFYRDVQLLPGGWIFLLPTFSVAFRMLRQYRIILSAAAAGAVLEPLGGNCAVLPKNNRHNLTRRNAAKGCACYFMRGYRSSWSWVGISSAWSGTPVQLPSGSLWLARFSSSMVCRSWWASAGV